MSLKLIIEDLIDKNAKDFEVAKAIKSEYKEYNNSLNKLFKVSSGKDFIVKHTKKLDEVLITIYKYILRKSFGSYIPMSSSLPITLVAMGSYGRDQLSVYSDIDLMLVYKEIDGYNIKPILEKMLYLAWDSGLKLGHRVHEVSELLAVSKEDITIKTALIESRLITGSKILWFEVEQKLQLIREDNRQKFISDKMQELQIRHKKYPINMIINLKESQGGLRDVHMTYWIAKVFFNIKSLKDLIGKVFSEEEYKEYRVAIEFLYRIRNALHLHNSKKVDTLQLEQLPDIIRLLEYKSSNKNSDQISFSTKLITHQHTIYRLSMIFLNRIIDNKKITKIDIKDFLNNSYSSVDFSVVESIELNTNDRHYYSNIKKFFYKQSISSHIYILFYANKLAYFVNPLKKILHLSQLDGYHKYPVGLHSIQTLYAIEHIEDEYLLSIYQNLSNDHKALLKLVALTHDSGKGRVRDHSIVGESLFKVYAKKLGFNDDLITTGSKLIRYHTTMSSTVYKKDIYLQKEILAFTSKLIDTHSITLLYLLTYADIVSVDAKLYNGHTKFLLKELYLASLEATKEVDLVKESARRNRKIEAIQKDTRYLELSRIMQKNIINIESNLLFLKYSKDKILDISIDAEDIKDYKFSIDNSERLSIEIFRKTPLNLGYLLAKLSFLTISDMHIYKLYNGIKYFKITYNQSIDNNELTIVEQIVDNSFDMSKKTHYKKPVIYKNEIIINTEHSQSLISISINAKDQKGLFAYISQVLDKYKVEIRSAKIFTNKIRVQDLLLIEKDENCSTVIDQILDELCTS